MKSALSKGLYMGDPLGAHNLFIEYKNISHEEYILWHTSGTPSGRRAVAVTRGLR